MNDFQKVLINSNIGYILGGLLLKEDIQSYFSLILTDIIEGYENSDESSRPLIFKVRDIEDYLLREEQQYSKELRRVDTDKERREILRRKNRENYLFNQLYKMNLPKETDCKSLCSCLTLSKNEEIIMQNKKETELFIIDYAVDLNKKDLLDKINKEKNNYVKFYLQKKLKIIDKDNDIFNNKILLDNIQKLKNSEKILFFYQKSFIISINIIKKILNKINTTLDAIPNSIKYISKVISDLLIKKYKKADTIDIYNQLANLFFMKLFKYVFLSPDCYPLINNVILSECTKNNLIKIFEVISQLISGEFYKSKEDYSSNYTPFNWYFIENINIIYNLCQKLTSTNTPWSKKSNNNKNYFCSYSICFNMEIFNTIVNIIDANRNIIFKNNKHQSFKALIDNKIIKNKEINKQIKTDVINYFLYFKIKYFGVYMNIKKASLTDKNFQVSEEININSSNKKKKSLNNIEIDNFDLFESKNILYDILLSINDSDINEIRHKIKNNSTKEILKILKNYYKSKTFAQKDINTKINNNYNQKNIPIEWNIDSLLIHLDKLNDSNTKNDYNNLYCSFSKDINNSLKKYNFKILSEFIEKSKYIKYYIKYFKNCQKKYVELIINSKIKNFFEREKINVIIKLTYNLNEKILNIYSPENNKDFNELENNKIELCKYMHDFINKFPNLSKIDKSIEPQLFEVEDKINLKGALNNLINILKVKMLKYFKEREKELAIYKIKKYILTKIYEKIYPQDYDKDDLLFYYKTISLSWIEPKHLRIPYEINIDNFLPITNSYFKQIDYEKSPSCKMDIISKIFNTISSAIKFCQGGNFSTDDIAPLFEYALIKARPQRLSSNLRYLEFFITKGSELNNMYFDFLKNNMNSIKDINFTQFEGITEEEFKQKCEEANKSYLN